MKIRPSSVHPPVVHPSVESIISEPIAWISFKFWFLLPLGHMPRRVEVLKKNIFFFGFFKNIFVFR